MSQTKPTPNGAAAEELKLYSVFYEDNPVFDTPTRKFCGTFSSESKATLAIISILQENDRDPETGREVSLDDFQIVEHTLNQIALDDTL